MGDSGKKSKRTPQGILKITEQNRKNGGEITKNAEAKKSGSRMKMGDWPGPE